MCKKSPWSSALIVVPIVWHTCVTLCVCVCAHLCFEGQYERPSAIVLKQPAFIVIRQRT